jgi:D-serine deaminase-like pyridoxal phosphate-dependent protein
MRGVGEGNRHLAIGQRVRVIPNHSCLAAACFDRYHIVQDGSVVGSWRSARGW